MIPESFKSRMKEMLGDEFDEFIASLENGEAVRSLRVNKLKCSEEHFDQICNFKTDKIEHIAFAYKFYEDKIGGNPLHHAGAFYVQDPSAMLPVAAAKKIIWPGMRVLDMCAAPGGKTTQLASLLLSEGLLVSNEKVTSRARILQGNVERMGIKNAVVINCTPEIVAKNYKKCFDFVLCDAPCSGEGMFRKYDNAADEWSEENVVLCAQRQKDILSCAAKTVSGGGYLMYSTCTFSKEENEDVISEFLLEHSDFEIVPLDDDIKAVTSDGIDMPEARRFYPHRADGEGQFLCLLRRGGDDKLDVSFDDNLKKPSKDERIVCEKFLLDTLGEIPANIKMFRENAVLVDDQAAPNGTFLCGVTLGEVTKGRLVPHHHFFSAYGSEMKRKVDLALDDPRLTAYLRGEGFEADVENGWCAVSVCGIALGGGKAVNGYVKNHYPKGLRLRDSI